MYAQLLGSNILFEIYRNLIELMKTIERVLFAGTKTRFQIKAKLLKIRQATKVNSKVHTA